MFYHFIKLIALNRFKKLLTKINSEYSYNFVTTVEYRDLDLLKDVGDRMKVNLDTINKILEREKLLYLATSNEIYPDNSAVCFAYDEDLHLYFGSYSDTLKCRNIAENPFVAISVGTLQIHGIAKIVPYSSTEYKNKRKIYDKRFPQYVSVFQKNSNELYEINPLAIWNYNPSLGEMNRDELIIDLEYYQSISPYKFHKYAERLS
ncbi:pyridoxamine 5'-phosphate oxidase family protein [Clostridium sp. CF012]|uniref:pyridoxamine 5'-phosphate oxidase family protein n=1 Tax=Clostridium sp. CF012 TaxID=2843319 RepID=UPI001C0DD939|nr:pyridoxamine 5'-phosphate oxidase family protein [Clostridium sp. CF012]MBU3146872.1 pyridoxamine 5'-phosphate oxidase family protein [Clostridium sp. CF012]